MGAVKRYAIASLAAAALLAGAFLAGKYTTPTKVEEKTVTRFVDRVVVATVDRRVEVAGPVQIRTVWRTAPAAPGCPEVREVERIEDHGPVTTTTDSTSTATGESTGSSEKSRTEETRRPRFRLEVSQDLTRITDPGALEAGGAVRFGPVWIGVETKVEDWKHPRATVGAEF